MQPSNEATGFARWAPQRCRRGPMQRLHAWSYLTPP
ncbi:MAG: hypothetical protein JWN65_1305 [Solirubrobacterales bacterium]|nr:hypothetical protein [Solirubrobacterales bacterium]